MTPVHWARLLPRHPLRQVIMGPFGLRDVDASWLCRETLRPECTQPLPLRREHAPAGVPCKLKRSTGWGLPSWDASVVYDPVAAHVLRPGLGAVLQAFAAGEVPPP
jgi:hypothetical protein